MRAAFTKGKATKPFAKIAARDRGDVDRLAARHTAAQIGRKVARSALPRCEILRVEKQASGGTARATLRGPQGDLKGDEVEMSENAAAEQAMKEAALQYHEAADARKAGDPGHQADDDSSATSAWPIPRAWPRPAWRSIAIRRTPFRYTGKGNRVAVISNGTAVLGLGNIGAAASKPVMEGKVALFKKFAEIDGFDIEVDETDPKKAGRDRHRARADLRCREPRGHQGPGMLRGRADLQGADGHSGLSMTTSTARRSWSRQAPSTP